MTQHLLVDWSTMSAASNAVASIIVLYIMQTVTADASFTSILGIVKLAHRSSLALLAILLMANAGATLNDMSDPKLFDLASQLAFLLVVLLSAVRHRMAPKPLEVGIT